MLMNTTFLGDSFSIKWQSRGIPQFLLFFDQFANEKMSKTLDIFLLLCYSENVKSI